MEKKHDTLFTCSSTVERKTFTGTCCDIQNTKIVTQNTSTV